MDQKLAALFQELHDAIDGTPDRLRAELADLRAELAARRAIDGWIRTHSSPDHDYYVLLLRDGTMLMMCDDLVSVCEVAKAPTYPALCASLGIEVKP
jgi:hypothetical protein